MYLKVNVTYELYVVLILCHVWFLDDHRFDFHSLYDNGIRSRLVPFHFKWHILLYCPWGEDVFWLCVGEVTAHGAKRSHAKEIIFDMFSLRPITCRGGGGTLEGMDEVIAHGAQETTYQLWMGGSPNLYVVVWYICDDLPYVRFYDFGIILLVLTDYSI